MAIEYRPMLGDIPSSRNKFYTPEEAWEFVNDRTTIWNGVCSMEVMKPPADRTYSVIRLTGGPFYTRLMSYEACVQRIRDIVTANRDVQYEDYAIAKIVDADA